MITALQIKNNVMDWLPVLSAFGVPELPQKKQGACIFCGGKTRARWIKEKQFYFCNQCDKRSRDGIAVIQEYNGWDFPTAIKELAEFLGISDKPETSYQKSKYKLQAEKAEYLKALQIFLCGQGSIDVGRVLTPEDISLWLDSKQIIDEYESCHKMQAA